MTTLTPSRLQPSATDLLTRILDQPELVAAVRRLEPHALGRLIDHIGLEDAGELVGLASTRQLERIFDDDLWHADRPGQEERFDPDRFGLWLEVMLEAGEPFAAQKLTELPEDLVLLALHAHVLVIDIDATAIEMSSRFDEDDYLLEKALDSCAYLELDSYRVIARRQDGQDAVFAVLTALDQDHFETLIDWLERLAAIDADEIDDEGGLYEVLTREETLEVDAAADREDRRTAEGFVPPAAAHAFLTLARTTALEVLETEDSDPTTRMVFRQFERAAQRRAAPKATARRRPEPAARSVKALMSLLAEADVLPTSAVSAPAALPTGGPESNDHDDLRSALADLQDRDATLHTQRITEVGYLANLLVSGCPLDGRAMRPVEAAEATMATCNLGLDHLLAHHGAGRTACEVLEAHSAVQLFRLGWHLLARDVAMPAARWLLHALDGPPDPLNGASGRTAETLAQRLRVATRAGHPWTERDALEALTPWIGPALPTVLALLDACPTLLSEDAAARRFIATPTDVERATQTLRDLSRSGAHPPRRPT